MTKAELIKLLKDMPSNAVIGFRANDLNKDFPAESFTYGYPSEPDDFAKVNQGIDFILS